MTAQGFLFFLCVVIYFFGRNGRKFPDKKEVIDLVNGMCKKSIQSTRREKKENQKKKEEKGVN
jgi:cbb3-type cytochrome oxidase subunit 3